VIAAAAFIIGIIIYISTSQAQSLILGIVAAAGIACGATAIWRFALSQPWIPSLFGVPLGIFIGELSTA
jgi:hypothetical protein